MEYTIKGPDPGNLVWGGVVAMTADELALEFLQQELKWGDEMPTGRPCEAQPKKRAWHG